jgi:hypothetical protein
MTTDLPRLPTGSPVSRLFLSILAAILTQVTTIAADLVAIATNVAALAADTRRVALTALVPQLAAILAQIAMISRDLAAVAAKLSPVLPALDGFATYRTRTVRDDVRPHRNRCGDLRRSGAPASQREHEEQPY